MADSSSLALEVTYITKAASYGYSALDLTDTLPDNAQLAVYVNIQQVLRVADNAIIDVSTLSASKQSAIRILDSSFVTVNDVTKAVDVADYTNAIIPHKDGVYRYLDYNVDNVEYLAVQRSTDINQNVVDYFPGSRLSSTQLSASQDQMMHAIQEINADLINLDAGTAGPIGPQGEQGIPGEDGTNGTNGTNGAPGPKGDTGDQGPKGDTGDQGPAGTAVSSVVSLPIGRAVWNSDTTTIAPNSFVRIFDSSHFPSASAVSGMGLTGDFSFTASSGTWGFVAPEDGNYSFSFQGSIGYSTGTLEIRAFGNWQVNSVNVTGETLYNYDDSPVSKLFPMTDTCVLQLSAGDRVSYQLSAATGSGTLSFRYGQVDVTQLTFDAALAGGITLDTLKAETAASTDFANFQARIAAL